MKPILFSTPMVQAILAGNKTMTRRVIKPQPTYLEISGAWVWPIPKSKIRPGCCECVCTASREWWEYLLPEQMKYQVGDILWVRETWNNDWCDHVIYKADGGSAKAAGYSQEPKWKPSIFMPREACRLFLRVTGVRADQLQDITIVGAQAEGDSFMWNDKTAKLICEHVKTKNSYIAHFAGLWDSINGKRDNGIFSWDKNPWVWVYEFERIEGPKYK